MNFSQLFVEPFEFYKMEYNKKLKHPHKIDGITTLFLFSIFNAPQSSSGGYRRTGGKRNPIILDRAFISHSIRFVALGVEAFVGTEQGPDGYFARGGPNCVGALFFIGDRIAAVLHNLATVYEVNALEPSVEEQTVAQGTLTSQGQHLSQGWVVSKYHEILSNV